MFSAFALFYAQAMVVEHDECSIGESSPKELSYEECVEDLVVEVTAPMVCDEEPVGGLARGKKVLHKNSHEDFPSSVSVSISGVCDKGHVHTAAAMVDLVKKRSGDSEPGASGLGESPGASSGNEDAPRVRSAFRSNTLSLPVPSRYIPRGAPAWYVSLGGSATGEFGGRFELSPQRMFAPTPKYDSSLLKLVGSASVGLDVVYQESKGGADENRFRAVRSKTCFAKFSSPTSFPFSVSFYLGGDLEEDFDEHGDYVLLPSAKPFVVYNFSAVDTNDASRTILVEEKREGLPVKRTLLFRKEANGQFSYGVVQGDGVFTNEIAQVSLVGNKRTIERRYTGKCGYSGVVLEEYDYIAGADVLIKRTETSGDEFRQSIYEYYPHADVSQLPRLRKETSYNGEVTEYVYDDLGRIIRETHTFPCGEVRVRENSYIPLGVRPHCPDGNGNDILTDDGTVEIATPRIETEKVNGIVISKTLRFVSIDTMDHRIIEEVRLLNPASDDIQGEWENPANERTYGDYKPKDSCRACSERPVLLKKADGTIERYSYGSGDYVPGAGGSAGVFTLRSGGEAFQSIVTRYPAQKASLSTNAWGCAHSNSLRYN